MSPEQEKRDNLSPFERLQGVYDGLYSRTDKREAKFRSHHIIITKKKTKDGANYFDVEVLHGRSEKPWYPSWRNFTGFTVFEKDRLFGLLRLRLPQIEMKIGDHVWNEVAVKDHSSQNGFQQEEMALNLVGWLESITNTKKITPPPITVSIFKK